MSASTARAAATPEAQVASGPSVLEGAILEVDRQSGKAVSITPYRFRESSAVG